jgi:hypothetical protein
MSRNSRVGVLSLGIVLLVIGAILRLATTVHSSGFNIHKIADVLLLVGVILAIVGAVFLATARRGRVRP